MGPDRQFLWWYGYCHFTHDDTVAKLPLKSTYAEPTIMWRIHNAADGRRAYSVILPNGSKATAGWFSQGIPQESRAFATWHDAICWLTNKLATLQLHGWQLEDPPPDPMR
jgi:hypothetical protein